MRAVTNCPLVVLACLCAAAQAVGAEPYKEPAGPWNGAAKPITSRAPEAGGKKVPVDKPGFYAQEGATYVLTKDISSPMTPFFLGKDVVLDLNGHTVTFADGGYKHIPNYSFDDGLAHWDVSKAPSAKVENTRATNPLAGDFACRLKAGEEIVSEYVELPVRSRAYYGTVAAPSDNVRLDVIIEDEQGKPIDFQFPLGKARPQACPLLDKSPQPSGGMLFALLWKQPAGRYRVRIRAKSDALIDCVDLVPAADVGIGICRYVQPWVDYVNYRGYDPLAFPDYHDTKELPLINGPGTVTIKNGTIRNGFDGMRTACIQSNAADLKLVLENMRLVNSGINTAALVASGCAELRDCRFEVESPFSINRTEPPSNVGLEGRMPSRADGCVFLGGQTCLSGFGEGSEIANCLFRNKQVIANQCAVMGGDGSGSGSEIRNCHFAPINGSGLFIKGRNYNVHGNVFEIQGPEPYWGRTDGKASADAAGIRLDDRNGERGWCTNNRIYLNIFSVRGRAPGPAYPNAISNAVGIQMFAGGGAGLIYKNEFDVRPIADEDKSETWAFYISGGQKSWKIYRNSIAADTTPVWIGTRDGSARNGQFFGNSFSRIHGPTGYPWFRLGYGEDVQANDIRFSANEFLNSKFTRSVANDKCDYAIGHTLTVRGPAETAVVVTDATGREAGKGRFDGTGKWSVVLGEFRYSEKQTEKTDIAAYTISANGKSKKIELRTDTEVRLE